MIATAMNVTAAQFFTNAPMRGTYVLNAQLITKDNAKDHYFPEFALLADHSRSLSRGPCGAAADRDADGSSPKGRLESPMKTMKGPGLFLAQFAGDSEPFNSLDAICRWAASLGYKGVQIPTWDARLFDLRKAAESDAYCDEIMGHRAQHHGLEITELSTHLQGQLVAVHPAFDEAFDGFAAPEVRGQSRRPGRNGRSSRCCWRRRPPGDWA